MTRKNSKRLFFALWPDDRVRKSLHAIQKAGFSQQGRPVHPLDLHVTLQYLGQVEQETMECVLEAAARTAGESFQLTIDQSGYWRRARVSWLGMEQVPEQLQALVNRLAGELEECGLVREDRSYKPHVTMARKSADITPGTLSEPVIWQVEKFCLVQSITGGDPPHYHPLHTWPLKK